MSDYDPTIAAWGDSYASALEKILAERKSAGLDQSVRVLEHVAERKPGNPPWRHFVAVEVVGEAGE